jgi:hypothetical protein
MNTDFQAHPIEAICKSLMGILVKKENVAIMHLIERDV